MANFAQTKPLSSSTDRPVAGMVLASLAALLLPVMDALAKLLGEQGAMSPGQLTFLRFAIQAVVCFAFLALAGNWRGLRSERFAMNFLRGALLAIGSLFFFVAIKYMPLADAFAIFFVGPLILTLQSFVFLREPVGWRRIVASFVGFGGALIVIQPSLAIFGVISILPLVSAACFATYLLLNRVVGQTDGPMAMQFVAGLGGASVIAVTMLVAAPFGVADMAITPTSDLVVWVLVFVMGGFGLLGHYVFVRAYQFAPASMLAPFTYLEIISAVALGWMLFGEFPTLGKWGGIAIIVGSGLYVFWRERRAPSQTNR